MIIIDKETNRRYSVDKRSGDFQFKMQGDSAIINEDVPISQARNSPGIKRKNQILPIVNKLKMTDAGIRGARLPNLTERGKNTQTTITQQRIKRVILHGGD
ncbi:MAG: hypothetical protein ACTSUC_09850 [Promethearchaeota archaeon]